VVVSKEFQPCRSWNCAKPVKYLSIYSVVKVTCQSSRSQNLIRLCKKVHKIIWTISVSHKIYNGNVYMFTLVFLYNLTCSFYNAVNFWFVINFLLIFFFHFLLCFFKNNNALLRGERVLAKINFWNDVSRACGAVLHSWCSSHSNDILEP